MVFLHLLCCVLLCLSANASLIDELHQLASTSKRSDSSYDRTFFIPNWPEKELVGRLGQVSGLAVCPMGHVFVFQRGDRKWEPQDFDSNHKFIAKNKGPIEESTILVFSGNVENGRLLYHFGANKFYLPHGLTVDHEGNVYVTDVALHQVMKFPRGSTSPSLVLGEAFTPGKDTNHFCKPTHVAVAKNGDFFVADGYCNSRIMKFDKNGKFLKQWGQRENGDASIDTMELNLPHYLALIEDKDQICVADREHERVVCYCAGLKNDNKTGEFALEIRDENFGSIYAIAYNKKFNSLYIMSWVNEPNEASSLFLYNFDSKDIIDEIEYAGPQGFGSGHALASCPDGSCLVVGALDKVCAARNPIYCNPDEPEGVMPRNIWYYGILNKKQYNMIAQEFA